LVYVKKAYAISDIEIDEVFETIKFSISFKSKNKRKHTFITSYNPHFKMSKEYLNYLEQYLKVLSRKSKSIVLVGDLNHDLHSNNGNNLKILMENQNFISYQNNPTHIIKNSKTCIDVVYCNNNELISATEVSSCPFSDHEFVSISLNLTPIKNGPIVIETRSLNQAKLNAIDLALSVCPLNIAIDGGALESIDDKFYTFKNLIMNVINEVAPLKTTRVKRDNLPWVDKEMRDLLLKRVALHTVAMSYNDKSHQIWDLYRDLRNFCRSTLRQKMRSFFVEKTTKEFTTFKDFWKFYNKFVIKTKKSKDAQIISNIIDPISKSPVSEPAEVANAFNEFFTNINGDSNITLDELKDFINEKFREKVF
jgi:hypothetical protein